MLKKLMKHEWQTGWKIPTIMITALLVISFFSGLTFAAPIWEQEMGGLEVLVVLVWMLYYFAVIGLNLAIMLYMAVRFYKSMFTDEGYLTHTLPVTARQLLLSKILPMAAWVAISTLAVFISVLIFGGMALVFLKPANVSLWELMFEGLSMVELRALLTESGVMSFFGSILCMMVVSVFSGVMMIVGSISMGQMVKGHKVLGSIGAYFVINSVISTITTLVMIPLMIGADNGAVMNVFDVLTPVYWIMTLVSVLITVGLYFLSEFLVRKKLNLD